MPAPIEWAATSLPECQIRVDVAGKATSSPIRVRVDGVEIARGRGTLSWTGPAFARADTATVAVGRGRARTLAADPTGPVGLSVARATGFDGAGPTTPTTRPVPITVSVATSCLIDGLAWAARAESASSGAPVVWTGTFATSHADASRELPVGSVALYVSVTWRGHPVGAATAQVYVFSGCMDSDQDGVCAGDEPGWDCDDQDPYSRPGLPDLLGDGRDNDCDGVLAGDGDGDGYERPAPGPPSADERARIDRAYADHPTLARSLPGVPPKLPPDCDDRDPLVHPYASERGLGGDDDCDGTSNDWRLHWHAGARLSPQGGVQVLDGDQIRSSGALSVPDWHPWDAGVGGDHLLGLGDDGSDVVAVLELRTGAGHRGWLVVIDEHDTWMVHSFTGRVGFVLIAGPRDALDATRIDLGRRTSTMGEGTSTLVMPSVSAGGITVGPVRYAWAGDTLVRR